MKFAKIYFSRWLVLTTKKKTFVEFCCKNGVKRSALQNFANSLITVGEINRHTGTFVGRQKKKKKMIKYYRQN